MSRILVVDDEGDVRALVRVILESSGHAVVECDRPEKVAGILQADSRFDAAILDVMMPGLSGFDLLRRLRQDPETRELPVLMLSARGASEDRVKGLKLGAHDYLAKPFSPEELVLRVERIALSAPSMTEDELDQMTLDGLERLEGGEELEETLYLGRYRVDAVLGRGATGLLLRGWDERLQREVALKTIRFAGMTGAQLESLEAGLLSEAVFLARFSHPHIVSVFDVAAGTGIPFIAMELVKGTSLDQYLKRTDFLAVDQVIVLGLAIARALGASHDRGLVHHDVKPANVLLGRDRSVKVTDFGVARLISSLSGNNDTIFGSLGYLPPETLVGEGYDPAGDLFGLGAILYECLGGRPAIPGRTLREVMDETLEGFILPLVSGNGESVPEPLSDLVMGLLEKDRKRRIDRADDVIELLADLQAEGGKIEWNPDLELISLDAPGGSDSQTPTGFFRTRPS